jgi:tetratricopeptide (TPR) repeat protein
VILFLYSFKTIDRNPVWRNDYTLNTAGIQDSPRSSRNYHNLATQLLNSYALVEHDSLKRDSLYNLCIAEYKKSTELYPENYESYRDMGFVYQQKNEFEKSIESYDLALKYNPRDSKSLCNKGVVLFKQKKYEQSIDLFKQAIKLNPNYTTALKNLGISYALLQDFDQALFYLTQSLNYQMDQANRIGTLRKVSELYTIKGNDAMANDYASQANALEAKGK